MTRESSVALVIIRLRVGGEDFLLLREHEKWGDWSLVGGHVEPDELSDWYKAAAREADEELIPLSHERDFELIQLTEEPVCWGPIPSRSAAGQPTNYAVKYYALKLQVEPHEAMSRLPTGAFRLLPQAWLANGSGGSCVSETLWRARDAIEGGFDAIPLAWPTSLDSSEVPISALDPSSGSPEDAPQRS